MVKQILKCFVCLTVLFLLTGCIVRAYTQVKERVDQDLTTGNRGYIQGTLPPAEKREAVPTRKIAVVEVELRSPLRFEKPEKPEEKAPETTDITLEGNLGYVEGTPEVSVAEVPSVKIAPKIIATYKVEKNDTLQKISQKFYGTTRKWNKIYQMNKDRIKNPDRIMPGQVLDIPEE